VSLAENQAAVEDLTAQGADHALADRVHRGAWTEVRRKMVSAAWNTASKKAVKFESRSLIRNRKPASRSPRSRARRRCLLDRPAAGRVGGDAEVHPAGAVLDEHQAVQPGQQHSIDVQEVDGQDPAGLRVQELPPGRSVPSRRGVDARGAQDHIDSGGRDRDAQLGQLAVNAPVAPERVSFARRMVNRAILQTAAGWPPAAACSCRYFPAPRG
jgi:hypothetical protein